MWRILMIATLVVAAGCSTQRAPVRVSCDRHLVPINASAPAEHRLERRSSSPPSGREKR